jgi:hypothetical protein
VPSASPQTARLAAIALGAGLLGAGLGGCSTTQEKAAAHRAEAERILKARAKRQALKNHKHHADGPKTSLYVGKSARRHQEGSE